MKRAGVAYRPRRERHAQKAIPLLETNLARDSHSIIVRSYLGLVYYCRAEAQTDLKHHSEAVKDWDRAIELDDGPSGWEDEDDGGGGGRESGCINGRGGDGVRFDGFDCVDGQQVEVLCLDDEEDEPALPRRRRTRKRFCRTGRAANASR